MGRVGRRLTQIRPPTQKELEAEAAAAAMARMTALEQLPQATTNMGVDNVRSVVFLHDSIHIVGGLEDGTMRKWDRLGNPIGKPWKGTGGSIYVVALSPDGKMIACGRSDGSVQRWDTNGKMKGAWSGHWGRVRSLSWSPSGEYIASGSYDGTILIRKAEIGAMAVGPIRVKTNQQWVSALAYSPSGDKIASGGSNFTLCIWHTMTGQLVVGPIQGLGDKVTSVVWSSDSTKLYSASDKFARVFDSTSGALLHNFKHNDTLYSIALSPQNNVLACVGMDGVAQLWDIESYQPLNQSFGHYGREDLYCVSFSQNGKYIACGKPDGKLIVRIVDIITPQQETRTDPRQETRPESPSSSCLDADATGGDGIIVEEARDDPYTDFFPPSLPAATSSLPKSPNLSSTRRFWNTISRNRKPDSTEPTPLQERPKRKFLARLARSNSCSKPSTTTSDQSIPEGELRAREEAEQIDQDPDLGALKPEKSEEDQREGSLTDVQRTSKLESKENRNIWRRFMGARGKDPTSINIAPAMKRPEVVDVHAVRGFQRLVVMTPRRGKKSSAVTCGVPLTAVHTGNSSQPSQGPSSQAGSGQAGTLLQASSGQGGPPSTIHGTQYLQVVGSPASHTSGPSHFVTANYHITHDSNSRSSLEGSCNRFLDKICFPRGHYH